MKLLVGSKDFFRDFQSFFHADIQGSSGILAVAGYPVLAIKCTIYLFGRLGRWKLHGSN